MRRAFSLIEVLVAVALVAGLAMAMSGFIWGVRMRRDSIATDAARLQGIASLFAHIEADVLTCVAGEAGQAGIQGGPDSLRLLTRGVGLVWGGQGPDVGDMQGAEYMFKGDRVSGTRWRGASREGDLGDDTIIEGLGLVRFRFFDQGQWVTRFDSAQAGRLPAAIEISVWFVSPPDLESDTLDESEDSIPTEEPGFGAALVSDEPMRAAAGADANEMLTGRPANPDRVRVIAIPDGPEAWGSR